MSEAAVCPVEAMPVGVVAARLREDPALADRLPAFARDGNVRRRSRFILEAAVCGELDDMELVEAIPELEDGISSFSELRAAFETAYKPQLRQRLAQIHGRPEWLPVFTKIAQMNGRWQRDNDTNWPVRASMDVCTDIFQDQGGTAVGMVRHLSFMAVQQGAETSPEIADMIRTDGVSQTRRQADMHFRAFNMLMKDIRNGDPHRIFDGSGRAGLQTAQPPESCPVGEDGQTAGEIAEAQWRAGDGKVGCPALKGSQIITKLINRVVDDGERFDVLTRPHMPAAEPEQVAA